MALARALNVFTALSGTGSELAAICRRLDAQSRAVCVGAGTPNRLTRLAETEALSAQPLNPSTSLCHEPFSESWVRSNSSFQWRRANAAAAAIVRSALSAGLDRLEFVVLDLHRDVKKRSILDIPETRGDWWEFFKSHLNARISAGKTRLCMFS